VTELPGALNREGYRHWEGGVIRLRCSRCNCKAGFVCLSDIGNPQSLVTYNEWQLECICNAVFSLLIVKMKGLME
jgi:hypothetical protein